MEISSPENLSLLEVLQLLSPESSKNSLRKWLASERVRVDGQVETFASFQVKSGQEVSVGAKQRVLQSGLKILYEDRHLVVIHKPAGLLSVATDFELQKTAHGLLKRHHEKGIVYPIHRLDKDTSGLLVFAYTKEARESLKSQLAKRTMSRTYIALVHGHLKQSSGTWQTYLFEDNSGTVHVCPPAKGKLAVSHYKILEKKRKTTLLQISLETGRKHQIRVHASHHGYPVVGDKKYGPEDGMKKLYLQAIKLSFIHPIEKKQMDFELERASHFGA